MALWRKSSKGNRQNPEEKRSLYPILFVMDTLNGYRKDLVQKEVASLWELSLVGRSFSGVIQEADSFQDKLQNLDQSFSTPL